MLTKKISQTIFQYDLSDQVPSCIEDRLDAFTSVLRAIQLWPDHQGWLLISGVPMLIAVWLAFKSIKQLYFHKKNPQFLMWLVCMNSHLSFFQKTWRHPEEVNFHWKANERNASSVLASGILSQAALRQEEIPSGRANSLWYPITAWSSQPATVTDVTASLPLSPSVSLCPSLTYTWELKDHKYSCKFK